MKRFLRGSAVLVTAGLIQATSVAASVTFQSRELFRVNFGAKPAELGARIDAGNLIIPADFTIDGAGHFYIYDPNHHRIARYSPDGRYEMDFRYLPTAKQVFAHADSAQNLWLLLSDPARGTYYGVYNARGKQLRSGIFSRYNHFRLHRDDDGTLHVILSSDKDASASATYLFDEESLLMKKENIARPPEDHHQIHRSGRVYFVDAEPGGNAPGSNRVNRITDEAHRPVAAIQGDVLYVTGEGELYTRVGLRQVNIYDADGSLKTKVMLSGLPSACASLRFNPQGDMYELDGIPDAAGHYGAEMPGMRMILWERQ